MRRLLAALLVAMMAAPAYADKIARAGNAEIRLFPGACVHGGTLAQLKPEHRDKFHKMQGSVNGRVVYGCWVDIEEDGVYWMLFEDGTDIALRYESFKEVPGT